MSVDLLLAKKYCRDRGAYAEPDDQQPGVTKFYLGDAPVRGQFYLAGTQLVVKFDDTAFRSRVQAETETSISDGTFLLDSNSAFNSFWDQVVSLSKDFSPQYVEDALFDDSEDDKKLTEVERLAKQRWGQQIYRRRLEEYWDSACAVTGARIPQLLRASHAKPWAECTKGSERLSPFNGFLLTANLDALFDKFLISFDEGGKILISPNLSSEELSLIGVNPDMRLRKIDPRHEEFLSYHREKFETHTKAKQHRH